MTKKDFRGKNLLGKSHRQNCSQTLEACSEIGGICIIGFGGWTPLDPTIWSK